MIDCTALPNGGLRIEIEGKAAEMPAPLVMTFIAGMLDAMEQHTKTTGDTRVEGVAIAHPTAASIDFEQHTDEPRLRFSFGKAVLIIAMRPGELRALANGIVHHPDRGTWSPDLDPTERDRAAPGGGIG
jgi:hypothetical protein